MELLGIVILVAAGFLILTVMKNKEREEARTRYQRLLAELKNQPRNPDLKERTLAAGRVYSNLTRNKKGQTLFDEVALMNDINAACAAAFGGPVNASRQSTTTATASVETRLQTLSDLRSKSLISPEEYDRRRGEILSSI